MGFQKQEEASLSGIASSHRRHYADLVSNLHCSVTTNFLRVIVLAEELYPQSAYRSGAASSVQNLHHRLSLVTKAT